MGCDGMWSSRSIVSHSLLSPSAGALVATGNGIDIVIMIKMVLIKTIIDWILEIATDNVIGIKIMIMLLVIADIGAGFAIIKDKPVSEFNPNLLVLYIKKSGIV